MNAIGVKFLGRAFLKENIIQILDGIDKKELKSLYDFVNSPFFNKSRRLSDFYELIYKNYDVYKANGLTKKELAKKLYPGETYSKKTDENIRKLLSDFGKLLDSYLITSRFMQDEDQNAMALVKTLRERGVEDRFRKKLADLKKKQEKVKYRDEKYYKLESELLDEALELEFTKKMLSYSETDQRASDYTDWNFIINKLRHYILMWNKQFYNKESLGYNWSFYYDIINFIDKNKNSIENSHPVINFMYNVLMLYNEEEKVSLNDAKDFLIKNFMVFPADIYLQYNWELINYAMLQVNKGKIEHRRDILDMIKNLDERNYITKSKYLFPTNFKIAVDIAFAEKEYDWAEYFINKYKTKIQKEFANGLTNLSLAKLNFFKGEYHNAKLYQAKVAYNDYIHYFDAKILLARIEFEKKDYNNVLGVLETLKKFIKSHNELPEIYLKSFQKFVINISLLMKIYEEELLGNDVEHSTKKLYDSVIDSEGYIYAKNWFIEKLEQIKKPELSSRL